MRMKSFIASLKNFFEAFLRGELLMRMGVDRWFPHIAYTFMLFWVVLLVDIWVEGRLARLEKTREVLTSLQIYRSEKMVELVKFDRLGTVRKMLGERGSAVTVPEKPADRIPAKER
ncbi:MAG: hypothetical protein ACI3ZO_03790 [Candidatus Cryptobacteroides sp.]|nr:hypothetical protein [Bacteroidales bacterium]